AKYLPRALAIISAIVLLIFALAEIMPFVFTVANSFKCLPAIEAVPQSFIPVPPFGVNCTNEGGVARSPSETTGAITFNSSSEGYDQVFRADLGTWFMNSIIYSVFVTILRLLFDSLAGYALARLKFPGNRVIFFLMLGTMMIPGIVLLIPRFIILRQ